MGRRPWPAPPRSLAALLAMVLVVGLCWALIVPPWQAPDETTHFAYVQSLAENHRLPGVPHRPGASSDESAADAAVGADRTAFYPNAAPPNWSKADYQAYLALEHGAHPPSRSDGSGPSAADGNPPLYYLYGAIAYVLDHGGTAFGRLYAIRLAGVLLLLATTLGAWLLAGETFGGRRLPQLACAGVAGLLPMATFVSTAVTPDALLMTTWTYALWLGARVINRRAPIGDAAILCGVTAAAILTKATSYALVPAVGLALLLGWLRRPRAERGPALLGLALALLALAVPVLAWLAYNHAEGRSIVNTVSTGGHPFNIGQFLSYVWQFYLPRLPFLTPFRTTGQLPVYDIWVWQVTGVFGWLDVFLPRWIYPVAATCYAALALTGVAIVGRMRDQRRLALLSFYAVALIALLGLLHITEYRAVIGGSSTFLQGRYLLPAVGIMGLAVGLVVDRLPRRLRAPGCTVPLTALLVLQAISLGAVVEAYYL